MQCYKLVGYINILGIIPDFMYPVYLYNGEYFFSDGDIHKIREFKQIRESWKEKIVYLRETKLNIERNVGDENIYIYNFDDIKIVVGEGSEIVNAIKNDIPKSNILKSKLQDFCEEFSSDECLSERECTYVYKKYYGTGRRKTSVARVYITFGSGIIIVNNKNVSEYFPREMENFKVLAPLKLTNMKENLDLKISVRGGGYSGQAEAIRHGISRALINMDIDFKPILKEAGFLTRDSRMKERKKYGLKAARCAPQQSKR